MTSRSVLLRLMITSALATSAAAAVAADATGADTLDTIIVTGTRVSGLHAEDSPAPIQLIDAGAIERVGVPGLLSALAQNVASFNVQANGGDTQNLTVAAALRGLNPNNTLVLINGKRRHGTANLSIDGGAGPFQGSAAPDLSFIPAAAIDHVEVLTDGAAAQYGTDAIAGVINIILKHNASGGTVDVSAGRYYDGDGATPDIWANAGFAPTSSSFVNVTAESRFHGYTDRGNIDPRALDPGVLANTPTIKNYPGYPHVNRVDGDALYHLNIVSVNAGVDLGGSTQLYGVATYGKKTAQSFENYRTPDVLPQIYPNGFEPQEASDETDYAFTAGIKGLAGVWHWDLSTTYGRDRVGLSTIDSGNVSLYQNTGSTPTSAFDGSLINEQWTTNFDVTREVDLGLSAPATFAAGVEYRRETYSIEHGDYAATYLEGMQSYPGFTATDAGSHSRNNAAGYVDFAFAPAKNFTLDAAARFENYNDFGNATVGKLTGRYDISPAFALRGTISNGFRAPTLAEQYYSATNVNINSAFVQLPPNSPGAVLVGIDGLKPEKSRNYSVGFVAHPTDKMTLTLDAYQIDITNRIAATGGIFASGYGGQSSAVAAAIVANGNVLAPGVTNFGIQMFANGLDTQTQGAEMVLSYPTTLSGGGRIDWSLTASYNSTKITNINPTPAQLGNQALYGPGAISDITTASPKYKAILSAQYTADRWTLTVRESLFGPSTEYEQGDDGNFYPSTVHAAAITDLTVAYRVADHLSVSVGATDLFDKRPNSYNPDLIANYRANLDAQSVLNSPGFAPYSINGGYYFGRVTFTF